MSGRHLHRMIIDTLSSWPKYLAIHPGFAQAFRYLEAGNLDTGSETRQPINGDLIFASFMRRPAKTRETARLEAHRRHIDIQFLVSESEQFGWKPTADCVKPDGDFNEERDVQFFKDTATSWHAIQPGHFVIFFPEDAHAPMVGNGEIAKVVVKVAVA